MRKKWVVVGALALACKGSGGAPPSPEAKGSGTPTPASASASGASSASSAAKSADGCLTKLDYLVPPQSYRNRDLIRALLVDGDQVFFRNMDEVMRVPLQGGPVVNLGKAVAVTRFWASGDELVTQSAGEPIFMKAKKSGGPWESFIDLTAAKKGGGRGITTRLLEGLGTHSARATGAAFDGKAFYYAEVSQGKGRNAPYASVLKSVSFGGGEARTLFETPGEITELTRVGDQVAFHLVLPPTAQQIAENEALRKKQKYVFGVAGENWVLSVPTSGGPSKRLMRLSSITSGGLLGTSTILGADGNQLYLSGYVDEDMMKPTLLRFDVASGRSQELDKRFVRGTAYVSGNRVVIVGNSVLAPGKTDHLNQVLTVPRDGTSITLRACLADDDTLHASAVAGNVALLSLFQSGPGLASIAKVPLD